MKFPNRHLINLTLSAALFGSSAAANLAVAAEPVEGVLIEDAIVLGSYPTKVQGGSVRATPPR